MIIKNNKNCNIKINDSTISTLSAKEMFEELDFKWKETKDVIEYSKSLFKHFTFLGKEKIIFYKDDYFRYFYLDGIFSINKNLLQAINKQCEELGWNK